jgi:hypothetical protein
MLQQCAIQYKWRTHDGRTCLNYDRVRDLQLHTHTHTRVTNHTEARFQALHFSVPLLSLPFPLRFLHLL